MKSSVTAIIVIAVFAAGFAVGRMSASPESSDTSAAPAQPSPQMMGAMGAQAEPPMMAPPQGAAGITGTIAEIIQVPNYTYLRLNTAGGEDWAAVSTTTDVAVGQQVAVVQGSQMGNFHSKTLDRTFATIWFGQLAPAGGGMAAAPAPSMQGGELPPGHPPMGAPQDSLSATAADALKGPSGSSEMAVSKVYDDRLSLAGRRVRVRGMVKDVKTVAGNTVLHLSDGSARDLPVVTKTALGKDEVVTLEGQVAVDVDPGTGTKEQVVVQDAMVLVR